MGTMRAFFDFVGFFWVDRMVMQGSSRFKPTSFTFNRHISPNRAPVFKATRTKSAHNGGMTAKSVITSACVRTRMNFLVSRTGFTRLHGETVK